jgi:hypothetical protein
MAGRINLKLRAHFFNKIGPKRRLLRDSNTSAVEGKADVTSPPLK